MKRVRVGVIRTPLAVRRVSGTACEWYGDTAYGPGDLRAAVHGAGQAAVIKPGPFKPAVEGGFTVDDVAVDDVAVDERAGTVTCPAGLSRPITACNKRLAQEPHRRPEPAHPDQPRPGPRERNMGTRLSDHRPAGTNPLASNPLASTPPSMSGWPQAGRATTLPACEGPGLLPHRRPCRRSSRP